MVIKAKRRWYATADGTRAVPEGDPDAATLIVGAEREIEESEAREWGIYPEPEPEEGEQEPENEGDPAKNEQ